MFIYQENLKNNSYLNQATQKNTCQMFLPKKFLRSSWSPKIRSTHWDSMNNKKQLEQQLEILIHNWFPSFYYSRTSVTRILKRNKTFWVSAEFELPEFKLSKFSCISSGKLWQRKTWPEEAVTPIWWICYGACSPSFGLTKETNSRPLFSISQASVSKIFTWITILYHVFKEVLITWSSKEL